MKRLNQTGSHVVALFVGVLVIGVVAFAGYTVTHHQTSTPKASTITAASSNAVPKAIDNTANLTQASKVLDDSSTQLDSGLNDSALDSDLNSML